MPTTLTGNSLETIHDTSQTSKKHFYCDVCQKKFTSKRAKNLHQKCIHNKIKDFECFYCNKKFSQASNLATHVKKYHFSAEGGDDEYQFQCSECKKDFSSKGHLKRHQENVHEKKKKYFCEKCHKMWPTKADADRHLRTVHEKLRKYKCDFCSKSFKINSLLILHVKTVHEGLKPFECQICNKTFSQKGNLNTHIARYHETNTSNDKISELLTSFQSELDDEKTANNTKESIVPSTEINNSKKNFQCLFCNKYFLHKENLKVHLKNYHTLDESSDNDEDENQSGEESEII